MITSVQSKLGRTFGEHVPTVSELEEKISFPLYMFKKCLYIGVIIILYFYTQEIF